jgi:hypothetical protein
MVDEKPQVESVFSENAVFGKKMHLLFSNFQKWLIA